MEPNLSVQLGLEVHDPVGASVSSAGTPSSCSPLPWFAPVDDGVGKGVGKVVGLRVDLRVGTAVGVSVGTRVGTAVGCLVGSRVGRRVGTAEGYLPSTKHPASKDRNHARAAR